MRLTLSDDDGNQLGVIEFADEAWPSLKRGGVPVQMFPAGARTWSPPSHAFYGDILNALDSLDRQRADSLDGPRS